MQNFLPTNENGKNEITFSVDIANETEQEQFFFLLLIYVEFIENEFERRREKQNLSDFSIISM